MTKRDDHIADLAKEIVQLLYGEVNEIAVLEAKEKDLASWLYNDCSDDWAQKEADELADEYWEFIVSE